MSSRFGAQVGVLQGFPLTASAQDVEDSVGAASVGDAGPASTKAMGVEANGNERLKDGPQRIRDAEAGGGWIIARALS